MSESPRTFTAPHIVEYDYRRSLGPVLSRFFTGLRDREIVGIRRANGKVLVPPCEADPDTGEGLSDFASVGPGGVVTTWAWVARPSAKHPLDRPFAWAVVQLDGADTGLLHAVDAGQRIEHVHGHARRAPLARRDRGRNPRHRVLRAGGCIVSEADPVEKIVTPTQLEYRYTAAGAHAEFLDNIARGVLVGKRCPGCKKVHSCVTIWLPST